MATSDITTSLLTDMNLSQNESSKLSVNGVGGGSELTQKKHKQHSRGFGVEELERLLTQERMKKMTQIPLIHPPHLHRHHFPPFNPSVGFPISGCAAVPNAAVQYHHAHVPIPAIVVQGIEVHGENLYSADPSVIRSSGGGFGYENSKELSSISNCMKCGTDGCGFCEKKKWINGGSNSCSVNPFRSFCRNNTVVEMMDAGKTRRSSWTGKIDWGKIFSWQGRGGADRRGWWSRCWCGSKE